MLKKSFSTSDAYQMFGLIVVVAVALSFFVAVAFSNLDVNSAWFWVVQGIYSILLGAVALVFSQKISKTDFFVAAKLNKKPKIWDVVFLSVALFFLVNAMTPINQWFCDLIEILGLPRPKIVLTVESVEKNLVLAFFVICLIAPLSEELVFRGVVANGLENGKNKTAAICFGGFLFAIFHMNPAQTLHQFLVGSLLALFLLCGKSLWTVVIGHMLNNIFAITLSLTVEKTGFYQQHQIVCAVVGLLLFFAVIAWYIFVNRQNLKSTNQQTAEKSQSGTILLVTGICVAMLFWVLNLVQM